MNEWIKINKKTFDLPSFLEFLIYTPNFKTSILLVSFCDTSRSICKKLHIISVDSCGMGDPRFMEIEIKDCTHWMPLPLPPEMPK